MGKSFRNDNYDVRAARKASRDFRQARQNIRAWDARTWDQEQDEEYERKMAAMQTRGRR